MNLNGLVVDERLGVQLHTVVVNYLRWVPVNTEGEFYFNVLAVLQFNSLCRVGGQIASNNVVAVVSQREIQVCEEVDVRRVVNVVVVDSRDNFSLSYKALDRET